MRMPVKTLAVFFVSALITTPGLKGQETRPILSQPTLYSFNCRDAQLEVLLDRLQDLTGKSITVDLGVQARFTLATDKITADELIDIITQALNAQDIRLENIGETTIRVRGTPKPKEPTSYSDNRQERISYIDRRRARMASGDTNAVIPPISDEDMKRHLADYQRAIAEQSLPPLPSTTGDELK